AWNMAQKGVTAPIIGPNSIAQLEDNLKALEVEITEDDQKLVDSLFPPGENVENYYRADWGPTARW
ncbi:MAG: aldo/keto reductase, partial [Chloroflexi bacterium]|nr:aldo/keto reductase [Chloroflexota bacterium]